jgi:hypothetical protein
MISLNFENFATQTLAELNKRTTNLDRSAPLNQTAQRIQKRSLHIRFVGTEKR